MRDEGVAVQPANKTRIAIRAATEADQARIVAITRAARNNPLQLKWQNFVVAVDEATGQIVGIGQIKRHRDGSRELASIATVPEYQGQGVARQVIEHLLAQHSGELYLTCADPMETFYIPFGFRVIGEAEMPRYFRRLAKLVRVLVAVTRSEHQMRVMKWDGVTLTRQATRPPRG